MKNILKRIKDTGGASLLEVLIALVLGGLVTTAVFEVYIAQHKNWTIQDDVVQIQQNTRAAVDELTRLARMAGYRLPLGLNAIEAYNSDPDTIIINFSQKGCYAPIESDMASPSADLVLNGHDLSCFSDSQLVYIFHPDSGGGEFFYVTAVDSVSDRLSHDQALSWAYPRDAIVIDLQRIKFYIDRTDTLHPHLMMGLPNYPAVVYAENIEDLQLRYIMKGGFSLDVPDIPADIRAIEITLVGRSDRQDIDIADNDSYRRRTYTSRVNLRNLDI